MSTHKKIVVPVVTSYFTKRIKNNRKSLKTSLLALVISSFLTACGGGSGGETTAQPQPTPTTPIPTPAPDNGSSKVIDFDYIQRSAGAVYNPGQVQTASFANASGDFRLPLPDQNLVGNLTISVDLSDPDGIKGVYFGFTGTTKVETLCSSNCGTDFHLTVTGINPLDHGVTSGNQRLELWVGDNPDNVVTVGTVDFNWHVTPITGINATRLNNTINLGWNPLNNYLRYNVYVASQPGVTPDNYQTLADGQAFLALRDPALALDHKEDSRNFYTMVTGIDGSGESAFGEPLAIMALAEVIDLPPDAVDDAFSMNEDESLTAGVLGNDSDLESAFVTINTAPITQPENGLVTINADGTFTYQPAANFSGRDGFVYQISDGVGNTDIAVVAITVIEANDPPLPSFNNFNIELGAKVTANAKNAQTFNIGTAANELIVLAPGLLINDLDIDSGALRVLPDPVEGPFQGTLVLQEDGGFTYTTDAGASDTDTFIYRTIDDTGATADSVVTITINGGNFFPVAANERYTLNEDETFNSTVSINNPSILSNDFDLDSADTLTIITDLPQTTTHGLLNLAPDGTFTYQPNAGFYGIDSFKYRISDPQGALAEAAVILTIVKKNNPPFAILDIYQPLEDTTFSVNAQRGVLANDSDPDFDPKFATTTPVEPPIHGQLTLSQDGSFSYIPDANFFGTDSFRYEVQDDSGLSAIGTVRLTVINVNDNPVAIDDNAQTTSTNSIVINVLENDTDIEGDILNVESATVPANVGSSIIDTDNTLTFIPTNNFEGLAEIDYTISDGAGGTASAKVFVSVNVLNTAPVATDDNYTAIEDQNLNVNGNNQPRLLANDSDIDGNSLSVDRVPLTDVSHGSVTLSSNGTFNYRPDNNFFGEDVFVYQIRDNRGGFASATATINVTAVNDAPQAGDDNVATSEETLLNINVLANDTDVDNDTLTITSASASNGTTSILANNTLDYTPNLNFVGSDQISYSITDGNQSTDSAVVTVNVLNVNDAPSASNDFSSTVENTPVTVNVLTNDTDIDGDNLTVTQAIASNGNIVVNGGTSVTYTPNNGFSGLDNVVYFISDGNGGNDNATLTINVLASGNEPPVANDDTATTVQDVTIDIDVLANDLDPDEDTLSIFNASAILGSVTVLDNNNLRFVPLNGFVGIDTINYNIDDGNGGVAAAIVTVVINAVSVNSPPVANNDSATTDEDITITINVLNNDSDADNDPLSVTGAAATLGNVSIAASNDLIYQPPSDFFGTDTIIYSIADSLGQTSSATVTITVISVNDSPVALVDTATTNENTSVVINILNNDSDIDSDTLTVVSASAANGVVVTQPDQTLSYLPNLSFAGNDTINYTISDNDGGFASSRVIVTINGINDSPIAVPDLATATEDTLLNINVLINDTDVDSEALSISAATAQNGIVELQPNQTLNYLPNANFNGSDTINYSISDGNGGTASSTVSVTVTPVNDAPVAVADTTTAIEDTLLNINVLVNDTDVDSDALSISAATAQNGIVELQPNQTLNYLPNANFNGSDTINYSISDGNGGTASSTVSVTVTPVNDAPVAVADTTTAIEDTLLTINVLVNDTDVDSTSLTVSNVTAQNGTVEVQPDQTLNYQADANFNGIDTINYTLNDGAGGTANSTVTVTITPVNDLPEALDDVVTTNEEIAAEVDVLVNDTDVDGDTLVITSAVALHGISEINAEQTLITYTPELNYTGADTITYIISDQQGGTATAKVEVTVFGANDNPIAVIDVVTTPEDTLVNIDVVANDTDIDSETLTITAGVAANGTVVITQNNTLDYTPKLNYNGEDTINYTISDNEGGTASSTVTVTITAVNDSPIAQADTSEIDEDNTATIDVLTNDSDPEDDTLTVTVNSTSNGGSVVNADNTLSFFPEPNFNGQASIEYTINDGNGLSASAIVTITVNPVNDNPVAVDDSAVGQEDESLTIAVLANDNDIEGDTLTVSVTSVSNGGATLDNNNVIFVPTANYNGSAQVQYTISDGNGGSANATVAITIIAINDAPVAVSDVRTTDEDTINTIFVLTNDTDADGDTLTITAALADSGRVSINPDQTLVYIPLPNFNGIDNITYTISDDSGSTSTASVTMTVTPINDQPVALDDSQNLDEDVSTTLNVLANDSDIDEDSLKIIAATSNDGTLSINDGVNGQTLQFVPNSNFNGETTVSYTITDSDCTVVVNCGAGHTANGTVTLTVNPINDAPVITGASATIAENAVNGFSVVTMQAQDIDLDTLNYAITTGNTDSIFAISSSSGEITVADKSFLDFATTGQYTLTITVTDTGNLADATDVVITITEIIENQTLVADSSFGNTTISGLAASNAFAFDNNDTPLSAVLDSTGRVIMVGSVSATTTDVTVTRYLADGRLDHSFGIQGVLNKDLGAFENATHVAVDANDNIYIAGELFNNNTTEIFVIKLLASGVLDTSFNNSGILLSTLNKTNLLVAGILINTDGNIIVGAGIDNQFELYQYNASNGTLIARLVLDMTGEFDRPQAIAGQNDGKILIAGFTADASNNFNYDFAVARVNSDFSLDGTFASAGRATFDLGQREDDIIYDIKVDSSGNIILLGSTSLAQDVNDVALAVMDSSGILRTDIGTGGITIIDADQDGGANTNSSVGKRLTIDSSNNLYLGVQLGLTDQNHDIGIVKLTPQGIQDASFGSNGIVSKDIGNDENALAGLMLDSSSRVMVATSVKGTRNQNFALARFSTSGTLDTSFVNRGYNTTNQTPSDDTLYDAVELTSSSQNGKMAMVGSSNGGNSVTDLIVARYNTSGSLDTTFAVDGYYRLSDNSASAYIGKAITELSDGRLVVTGWFGDNSFVLMLDSNGKPESSFDSDGIRVFSATSNNLQLAFNAVAIDSNNKIVIGGYARNLLSDSSDIYLNRLNLDGSFDASFGSSGVTIQDLSQLEQINNISILSDNAIVVVGSQFSSEQAEDDKALIAKFTSSGALDTSGFGSGGFQSLDVDSTVSDNRDILFDVVVSNGIIYAGGASTSPTGSLTAMVSLNINGQLNSSFSFDGLATLGFGSSHANRSLALDASGKLLLTGTSINTSDGGDDVYIARLTTDGAQDPVFNNGSPFIVSYNTTDSSEAVVALTNGSIMIAGHNQISGYSKRVWYLQVFNLVQ